MFSYHTGWNDVKRQVFIVNDLEITPLEIKTNSTVGSNERLFVLFRDAWTERAGGIDIRFDSKLQYRIHHCNKFSPHLTDFPTTLPSITDKVWRVTLDKTSGIRLKVHCNNEEVINILLTEAVCTGKTNWKDYWSKKIVKFFFSEKDTASDEYRFYSGIGE